MNQDLFKKAMTQFIVAGLSILSAVFMLLPWLSFRGDGSSLFEMSSYVDVLTLVALVIIIGANILIISKVNRNLGIDGLSKKVATISLAAAILALFLPVLFTMEFNKAFSGLITADYGIGFFLFIVSTGIAAVLSFFAVQGRDKEMLAKAQGMAGNMAKKVDNMTNEPGKPQA